MNQYNRYQPHRIATNYKQQRKVHQLTTPEGVELPFTIANKSERFGALVVDQCIIFAIIIFFFIVIPLTLPISYALQKVLFFLLFFFVRNFYYIFFEVFMNGMTPAKKIFKLKVINIEGGTLDLSAIFIRNMTREVEIMFPLAVLFSPPDAQLGFFGAFKFIGIIWIAIAGLVIFINKNHRRMGDLIAGTIVVNAPKKISIHQVDTVVEGTRVDKQAHSFSQEHLQHYGEFELQKLEYVLRNNEILHNAYKLNEIANSIRRKINWVDPVESDFIFLQDFYKAQRQYLENNMLFGRRRASKYENMKGD